MFEEDTDQKVVKDLRKIEIGLVKEEKRKKKWLRLR